MTTQAKCTICGEPMPKASTQKSGARPSRQSVATNTFLPELERFAELVAAPLKAENEQLYRALCMAQQDAESRYCSRLEAQTQIAEQWRARHDAILSSLVHIHSLKPKSILIDATNLPEDMRARTKGQA